MDVINTNLLFHRACDDWDNGRFESAFKKFHKAAILGDVSSQNNLGIFFEEGIGTKKNIEKAIYWYEEAMNNGNISAISNLATLYKHIGNCQKSVEFFERSIEAGDGDALFELGIIYLNGEGVIADEQRAYTLFVRAVNSNEITEATREKAAKILATIEKGGGA